MSRLAVFTFEAAGQAGEGRAALTQLEKRHELGLDDAAVVTKGADGQVVARHDPSRSVLIGAIIGALMGVVLMFMFPVIGVLFGAGAGALIGRLLIDQRVDGETVSEVGQNLLPGTSALLVLIRSGDVMAMMGVLRSLKPRVYQTTLSPELDARMRQALQ